MNYEEMLAAKNEGKLNKTLLPIGEYYRVQIDGKYRAVIDVRPELNSSIAFSGALKTECERNKTLVNRYQLHYTPVMNENGEVEQLEVEAGVFLSMEQLLNENPAVVAEKGFIDNTLQALVDITTYLHSQGIRHICYSPKTVMVRKGDHAVMLLSHGSFYLAMDDQRGLYGDDAVFVAPEVLEHGTIDDRCDVYSIGKFMETIFQRGGMSVEYDKALKKATSEKPEDRYDTPQALWKAVQSRRSMIRSGLMLLAAVIVALVIFEIYTELVPEPTQVEYVKPAPRQATDDLLDDGFKPEDLGVVSADSLSEEDLEAQRVYKAKAEEIFRKNYEKEADRILSKIYNKDYMNSTEKRFAAESQSTIEELMKVQQKMGQEASLTPERAQLIASEIIERVTNEKKKQLKNNK
jgi:serine/threonine protein kinase